MSEIQKALSLLGLLTAPELAHAYVQLNCFKWPDALREFKPARWEAMLNRERYRDSEFKQIWEAVKGRTTPFERSQAWWEERLGRSRREHLDWWKTNGASSVGDGLKSANASYNPK